MAEEAEVFTSSEGLEDPSAGDFAAASGDEAGGSPEAGAARLLDAPDALYAKILEVVWLLLNHAVQFLQLYGWYCIAAAVVYLFVGIPLRDWLRRRAIVDPRRVAPLADQMRQARILQQEEWQRKSAAMGPMPSAARKKKLSKEEERIINSSAYRFEGKPPSGGESTSTSRARRRPRAPPPTASGSYRPSLTDRYPNMRGGGGGG